MTPKAGIYAYPGGAVYCATKAAVKMLSDGIRMDTIATDISRIQMIVHIKLLMIIYIYQPCIQV